MDRLVLGSILLFTLISTNSAYGNASSQSDWDHLRSQYDAGRLNEALRTLQSRPGSDPHYFYNLGTIYLRLERPGTATAYLEKANRLRPHDPDIRNNLRIAQNSLSRVIGQDRLDPASSWLEDTADSLSLNEIRGTLGLFALILSLSWLRSYLKTRNIFRTLRQPAGVLGLLGFLITGGLYVAHRLADSRPPAICLERQSIKSGPGEDYLDLGRVEEGMKVRLLGPSAQGFPAEGVTTAAGDTWYQVRYSRDGIGWLRGSKILSL